MYALDTISLTSQYATVVRRSIFSKASTLWSGECETLLQAQLCINIMDVSFFSVCGDKDPLHDSLGVAIVWIENAVKPRPRRGFMKHSRAGKTSPGCAYRGRGELFPSHHMLLSTSSTCSTNTINTSQLLLLILQYLTPLLLPLPDLSTCLLCY